jgi:serine/threonine protein kinase
VAALQRKEINILKRVSFNRNVVQFYGFCLDKSAPMLVRSFYQRLYGSLGQRCGTAAALHGSVSCAALLAPLAQVLGFQANSWRYLFAPAQLGCPGPERLPCSLTFLSCLISQVMELMEGGDLRKALWQNQEEYAWERRGAQVLHGCTCSQHAWNSA